MSRLVNTVRMQHLHVILYVAEEDYGYGEIYLRQLISAIYTQRAEMLVSQRDHSQSHFEKPPEHLLEPVKARNAHVVLVLHQSLNPEVVLYSSSSSSSFSSCASPM